MNDELWNALAKCRSVTLRTSDHRPPQIPPRARVRLVAHDWKHVTCRRRAGESIEAMVWRALAELSRREAHGMPKPDPKAKRRRALRKMLDRADRQNVM